MLLLQSGLYKVTYLLMACGIASVAAPILVARTRNLRLSARRVLPGLVGVVAALALASHGPEVLSEYRASSRLREADPGSPNVLLIVLDTVRADGLSLHGYYRDTSPNLVRLASQGVRFDRAISAAPWTLASHATMFTGRWPHELGVGSYVALDHRYTTLAEALGERGYVTGGFCANTTFGHAYYGLARGFIHYEDLPVSLYEVLRSGQISGRLLQKLDVLRYKLSELCGDDSRLFRVLGDDPRASLYQSHRRTAERINRDAMSWMSAQRRPFFAFLNYYDAHGPYFVPRGSKKRFGRQLSSAAENTVLRYWEGDSWNHSAADVRMAHDAYDDCIAYLDEQLGQLFRNLDSRGLLKNTVVVLTSDHGEHFGEHGTMFGHKFTVYDQETHVPLLVIAPGRVPADRVVAAPVSLRDLPATVLDLAGLEPDSRFPGHPLSRFWNPNSATAPTATEPVFSELDNDQLPANDSRRHWQSISAGDLVYIRTTPDHEELYNITVDPAEARNLAGSPDASANLNDFRTALNRLLSATTPRQTPERLVATDQSAPPTPPHR